MLVFFWTGMHNNGVYIILLNLKKKLKKKKRYWWKSTQDGYFVMQTVLGREHSEKVSKKIMATFISEESP